MEPITTRVATLYLDADGIIRITTLPGLEENLEDAKNNMVVIGKLGQGKRRPVVANIGTVKSASREARAMYGSEEAAKFETSLALVVDSPVSRMIGNFFITFTKGFVPIKLFATEAEAVEWSKGFIE